MTKQDSFGSICAVVVTYNIGNAFDSCFNSVKGQVDHVVIVNTSVDDGTTRRALDRTQHANPDFVDVMESPANNLAQAQNLGIATALEKGFDWVLLLDHDSRLKAGMIPAMEAAYNANEDRESIGLIAPNLLDANVDEPHRYVRPRFGYWFERKGFDAQTSVLDNVLYVAASGSLIPARVLRSMRMDESLVIDHIDTDFCLKLRCEGWHILAVRDAKLVHKTGERRIHRLLGLTIITTNHPPLRRYYHFRNRIKMWKRYTTRIPSFMIFDLIRMVYELWRIILFETNKNAKLTNASLGFWDGIRGKSGPKPGTNITRDTEHR